MTNELSKVDADDPTRVSWDVFYRGEHGFGEHFQVIARDSKPIIEGRAKLLDWLKGLGARPQARDIDFPSKTPAPAVRGSAQRPVDPMLAAAQQVLGAAVGRTCPIHDSPMKRIPGTAEHGRVSKNGKSYPAFWVCEAVEGCRGE